MTSRRAAALLWRGKRLVGEPLVCRRFPWYDLELVDRAIIRRCLLEAFADMLLKALVVLEGQELVLQRAGHKLRSGVAPEVREPPGVCELSDLPDELMQKRVCLDSEERLRDVGA